MRSRLNVVFAALFVAWGAALLIYGFMNDVISIFGALLVAAGMWTLITRRQARP